MIISSSAAPPAPVSPMEIHFLDTNAYAVLLSGAPADADTRLRNRLFDGASVIGVISEITSLEIHSVIGQLSRGQSGGLHQCDRQIESAAGLTPCVQRWSQNSRKPLRPLEVERLRKAVKDAESGRGPIRLTVVPFDVADMATAKGYLYGIASTYNFGSHDALIAAAASRFKGGASVRLVTSDRGLKALLRVIRRPYFDPQKDELWDP